MSLSPANRDLTKEQWLEAHNVSFRFVPEFPLHTLAPDDMVAEVGQVRLGPNGGLTADWVATRLDKTRDGEVFPPIIVNHTPGREQLDIIDGRHRRALYEAAGRSTIDAYVTNVDVATFQLLAIEVNFLNGMPLNETDTRHAVGTLIDQGYTQQQVALAIQLPLREVSRYLKLNKAYQRAVQLRSPSKDMYEGNGGLPKISANTFILLDTIVRDVDYNNVVSAIRQHKPNGNKIAAAISALKQATTDEMADEAVRSLSPVKAINPLQRRQVPPALFFGQMRAGLNRFATMPVSLEERRANIAELVKIRQMVDTTIASLEATV